MGADDLAVHVRCCEPAGMCKWLFMPYGYYAAVLDRNKADHPGSAPGGGGLGLTLLQTVHHGFACAHELDSRTQRGEKEKGTPPPVE